MGVNHLARKPTVNEYGNGQALTILHEDNSIVLSQKKVLSAFLILALTARIYVAYRYEINWDEFFYLSFIYKYTNHTLYDSLQTFHVHFFTWLKWISANEVNQIITARLIMLSLQLATGFFIYRISRRYLNQPAALFAVLSYFSVSYNIRMGASFRADPFATFCLMASLDLILTKVLDLKRSLLSGALIALSLMVTIKSSLYLPTFALIALALGLMPERDKLDKRHILTVIGSTFVTFLLLYFYHKSSISVADSTKAINTLSESFNKTIKHYEFLPRERYLFHSFKFDIFYWLVLLYGFKTLCLNLYTPQSLDRQSSLILACLILPLCSVFFYRNAFPYFYSFMLAPASIICGVAWNALRWDQHKLKESFGIASCVLLLMGLSIAYHGFVVPHKQNLDRQHKLLEVVHKAFPEPTPYFDRCSMIASYPQVGFFMSTWGVENYTNNNLPVLRSAILNDTPPFFIANVGSLDFSRQTPIPFMKQYAIIENDLSTLKENYIHHWGELYVAGKQLYLPETRLEFSIVIPGVYTLESKFEAVIDGLPQPPGSLLYLASGEHIIESDASGSEYTLRWGKTLYRPTYQPDDNAIFTGF
jgi:hypothetical protein